MISLLTRSAYARIAKDPRYIDLSNPDEAFERVDFQIMDPLRIEGIFNAIYA